MEQIAREVGVAPQTIRMRLSRGYPMEEAVSPGPPRRKPRPLEMQLAYHVARMEWHYKRTQSLRRRIAANRRKAKALAQFTAQTAQQSSLSSYTEASEPTQDVDS